MFEICHKTTQAELRTTEEMTAIRRQLVGIGYSGLVDSIEAAVSKIFDVSQSRIKLGELVSQPRYYAQARGDAPMGELFVKGNSLFLLAPLGPRLSAWEIRSHRHPAGIDTFLSAIEQAIRQRLDGRRVRGMSFDWKASKTPAAFRRRLARHRAGGYRVNKLKTRAVTYSAEELDRSKLLTSRGIRDALIALAKVGNKAKSSDAATILEEEPRNALLNSGVIKKEYLLVCRENSRTICSIPDKERLEKTIGSELSCTSCGRAFTEELVQEIYALTNDARTLLNGSHWMTIWVTALLIESGIPKESIEWNAAAGDDELDIVVHMYGLVVFFELKDREFGVGDAYPFSFRVERYGGDVGVIVTTDRIAEEAEKFLEEQRARAGTMTWLVAGESEIGKRIPVIVDQLSGVAVGRSVAGSEDQFGLNIWPLIKLWMNKNA